MATLWAECKPTTFLMMCSASVFKIIQTSKGKRKLVGYFENCKVTLKALDKPQVFLTTGKKLKQLKKAPNKLKAKNISNKKSGNAGQQSDNINLKPNANKQVASTKDPLKDPKPQKLKSNKKNKANRGSNTNKKVLAEISITLELSLIFTCNCIF